MKNQYVGDIGDYGKYGLLRFLANHGICIGVNWYLTENDESSDGKFTDYLKDKESPDRLCDPELFDTLRKIVLPRSIQEKNVDMIREAELIPNACYYNSLLPDSNQDAKAREIKHPKLMGLLATSGKSSEGIILYLLHRRKYPIKNITKEEQNDIDRRKKIALVGIIFMVVGAIGFVFFIVRI